MAVVRAHGPAVKRFCSSLVPGDQVDDALQETFLAVWNSIGSLPPEANRQRPWIIDRARTACKKLGRDRRRFAGLLARVAVQMSGVVPEPSEVVIVDDEFRRLLRRVGSRSQVDADILRLSALGFSIVETAEQLGMARGAVDTRLSRLRARLASDGIAWGGEGPP